MAACRTHARRLAPDLRPVTSVFVAPRLQGRFSWTGTQSRPKFSNSAYSVTINENTGVWSQGNPNLDPYRASNWDASFEFYPRSLGIISAGIYVPFELYYFIRDPSWTSVSATGRPYRA